MKQISGLVASFLARPGVCTTLIDGRLTQGFSCRGWSLLPAVTCSHAQRPFSAQPSTSAASEQGTSAEQPQGTGQGQPGSAADGSTSMSYGARQVSQRRQGDGMLEGVVHISNTMNNIILALTDKDGKVKATRSAGSVGFKNARKSQPVAAEKAADSLAQAALKMGYGSVVVKMKGVGKMKQLAAQTLHAAGLRITELQEITPVAYNGCRLPKRRRV